MAEPGLLELESVETCYGLSQVLFGLALAVAPGEMATLMGRNGMGKTTALDAVMAYKGAAAPPAWVKSPDGPWAGAGRAPRGRGPWPARRN